MQKVILPVESKKGVPDPLACQCPCGPYKMKWEHFHRNKYYHLLSLRVRRTLTHIHVISQNIKVFLALCRRCGATIGVIKGHHQLLKARIKLVLW